MFHLHHARVLCSDKPVPISPETEVVVVLCVSDLLEVLSVSAPTKPRLTALEAFSVCRLLYSFQVSPWLITVGPKRLSHCHHCPHSYGQNAYTAGEEHRRMCWKRKRKILRGRTAELNAWPQCSLHGIQGCFNEVCVINV